jgi:hypothetical protein
MFDLDLVKARMTKAIANHSLQCLCWGPCLKVKSWTQVEKRDSDVEDPAVVLERLT